MTSAVRDASNGAEFAAAVRDRYGLDARTLSGDEEARLTFLGATAARDPPAPDERLLVIDIGGGSTELVVGERGDVAFHVSTQVGVVRHSERHLHSDPPTPEELDALAADAARRARRGGARGRARAASRPRSRSPARRRSAPAIDLGYDARRRRGPPALARRALEAMLDRLAALPLAERREVPGLDPDRAPTIVAGVVVLTRGAGAPSASTRSRSPTATSSGAQRSSWHPPD